MQNNANEGVLLIPPTIVTQDDVVSWIKVTFINLSDANITALLDAYPSSAEPTKATDAKFETDGYGPATAVNVSQVATGQQQRAYVSFIQHKSIKSMSDQRDTHSLPFPSSPPRTPRLALR